MLLRRMRCESLSNRRCRLLIIMVVMYRKSGNEEALPFRKAHEEIVCIRSCIRLCLQPPSLGWSVHICVTVTVRTQLGGACSTVTMWPQACFSWLHPVPACQRTYPTPFQSTLTTMEKNSAMEIRPGSLFKIPPDSYKWQELVFSKLGHRTRVF